MSKTSPIDKLNSEISKILSEYSSEVDSNLSDAVTKVCSKGAKALRNQSSLTFKGKDYSKSWTHTITKNRLYTEGTIYSKMPGLPHLLEYGHAVVVGGRVCGQAKAHPHIAEVADQLVNEFEKEIKNKL